MSGHNRREEKVNLFERTTVILVSPESPENIGLVARCMKNTGFQELRIVGLSTIPPKSYKTAVHSEEILDRTQFFSSLAEAVGDLNVVFASSAKRRKNFSSLSLEEAVYCLYEFPPETKIGLLFGNERTGLTSSELKHANFLFFIPQATKQPSYNLACAVCLTLFPVFVHNLKVEPKPRDIPLSREEQEKTIRFILEKLAKKGFIHETNKEHITGRLYDFLGRTCLTPRDQELLLAIFSK